MNEKLELRIKKEENKKQAEILSRFFKTQIGEYGEGDIFLGIKVPIQRKIVKKFWREVSISDIKELLYSEIHEKRLIALLILIEKYKCAKKENNNKSMEDIFNFYITNTRQINNWDLVDLTAPNIIGDYLLKRERDLLYKMAKSESLWDKRISIISTFTFIRNNEFGDSFEIAKILIEDKHDLMHKAVGWMLREIGKRDLNKLEMFLKKNYKQMPRTMLRYAIERMEENKRKRYLKGEI